MTYKIRLAMLILLSIEIVGFADQTEYVKISSAPHLLFLFKHIAVVLITLKISLQEC
jgi:hypothetical protein